MGPELVTVLAGGTIWTAFERVMVEAKFKDAARAFRLEVAAEIGAAATAWTFRAGTPIDILFNGDLACRGYVDRYRPRIAEHGAASITVSGRSKSQDFIDSSADHPTGRFSKKTPAEIAQELDQFGVGITADEKLDPVDYQLTPGESCFRALEKLCRSQGVWASGQADGSIKVTRAGKGRNGPIVEGVNLKSGDADHNWSNRHSRVTVRGQRPYGHGADSLEIEAVARDNEVGRNRPVIVIQDDDTTRERAKKRAKHRRDAEAGEALRANCVVQGFRDDAGQLWTPGHLTYLESPFLGIAQDMAIEAVTYSQERRGGSLATLSLVDPRALGGKGRKGAKANAAWASDAGDDAE